MRIKFWWLGPHIHSYHVDGLHDKLLKWQDMFDREFKHGHREELAANSTIINLKFDYEFQPLFYKIIQDYYIVGESWIKTNFGIYRQTKDDNVNVYHNHIETGVITAVTYLNPPKEGEGGGLMLHNMPYAEREIFPEKDVIYTFPSWLNHKPLPQTTDTPRYSINWGYNCNLRPIHKLTGDRW